MFYMYLSSWVCLGRSVIPLLRAVAKWHCAAAYMYMYMYMYVIYLNRNKVVWHTMPYTSRLEFIGSVKLFL